MHNMDFVNSDHVNSTTTTVDDLAKALNSKQQTNSILLDFNKAFDSLPSQAAHKDETLWHPW